jgi:ABC-2 type transport system ATP-binding protein
MMTPPAMAMMRRTIPKSRSTGSLSWDLSSVPSAGSGFFTRPKGSESDAALRRVDIVRPVSAPAIQVTDLHKSYGPVEAVRGVSFAVERGEVFGLLGPNGAGKTTTVEILEGYRQRTGGTVEVLGHDPQTRARELQQRVGIVLQEGGFYPRLTVREAVAHMAKAYPQPRDVEETIALVGLGEKADDRSRLLSGGQRRRLDLALALVGDPELVFLDEPTTGFDPAARRTAWSVIEALKGLGKTILLTTHYLEEAQVLADRVAIVKDGLIAAEGPPSELGPARASYRVAYIAGSERVEHRTDDPTDLLHRLTGEALARGERLEGLEVSRPTLEEVYLELTEDVRPEAELSTQTAGQDASRR